MGAILVKHGTSGKASGHKSASRSGYLSDTQIVDANSEDQVQSRVRFSVKHSVKTSEPDA